MKKRKTNIKREGKDRLTDKRRERQREREIKKNDRQRDKKKETIEWSNRQRDIRTKER